MSGSYEEEVNPLIEKIAQVCDQQPRINVVAACAQITSSISEASGPLAMLSTAELFSRLAASLIERATNKIEEDSQ